MLHPQYYVEKAKLEKLIAKRIEKVIFIMVFLTVMKIRY